MVGLLTCVALPMMVPVPPTLDEKAMDSNIMDLTKTQCLKFITNDKKTNFLYYWNYFFKNLTINAVSKLHFVEKNKCSTL
jgi:hypothetical protein